MSYPEGGRFERGDPEKEKEEEVVQAKKRREEEAEYKSEVEKASATATNEELLKNSVLALDPSKLPRNTRITPEGESVLQVRFPGKDLFDGGYHDFKMSFGYLDTPTAPAVRFTYKLYHPMVDPETNVFHAPFLSKKLSLLKLLQGNFEAGVHVDGADSGESLDQEDDGDEATDADVEAKEKCTSAEKAEANSTMEAVSLGIYRIICQIEELMNLPNISEVCNDDALRDYNRWAGQDKADKIKFLKTLNAHPNFDDEPAPEHVYAWRARRYVLQPEAAAAVVVPPTDQDQARARD